MVSSAIDHGIELAQGKVTPSEASDLIEALISKRINLYKLQKLQSVIRDEACDTNCIDQKIIELMEEKKAAKDLICEARKMGINLSIDSRIALSLTR